MYRSLCVALLLSVTFKSALAQGITGTDPETFIQLTEAIEDTPLGQPADILRAELLVSAYDFKEAAAIQCDILNFLTFSEDAPNSNINYIYLLQILLGSVAYQLENSSGKDDIVSAQMAGIRSLLRTYESVLSQDPNARMKRLDRLLKLDRQGKMEAELAPLIQRQCTAS